MCPFRPYGDTFRLATGDSSVSTEADEDQTGDKENADDKVEDPATDDGAELKTAGNGEEMAGKPERVPVSEESGNQNTESEVTEEKEEKEENEQEKEEEEEKKEEKV